MGLSAVVAFVIANASAVLTAASIAYQLYQAKKMKKAARDAAEARKGFEFVVDGDVYPVPIVYGRAKVGGIRVFAETANSFYWPSSGSNADASFSQGQGAISRDPVEYSDGTFVPQPDIPSNILDRTINGKKNEFLFYEQVLCQGPINNVIDVVFEESRFLDDPDFVKGKAGLRVDVHYEGGTPDSVISTNFSQRKTAFFTDVAHASVVIRLNRDDPQFGGSIPAAQFFIEGRKVRTISNGTLSSTRVYTNNPAYCLLDYLLEDNIVYTPGKALTVNDIDLASFEAAAQLCNTIVATNKPVGGKIWNNTSGNVNIDRRDIPLYECNIVIDSTKPIRENVEAILSTMGDARLVWSQGKYKLLLQYPATNEAIQVATEITDDDLVQGATVDVNWPDSSQRLNHAVVRFHNEGENFKEDTAVWPPKTSGTSTRGFNGKYYPQREPKWPEDSGWNILNDYGVWEGNTNTTTVSWKFIPLQSGNFVFTSAIDDSGSLVVTQNGNTIINRTISGARTSFTDNASLVEGTEYLITMQGVDNRGEKAVAFTVTGPDGLIAFSSRSIAYEQYIITNQSSAIYDQMLSEDNGIELENDIFLEGCTDYYHALAKAEELVRTSRTAFGIKFKYVIRDRFIEPGDIIRLNSNTLNLGESTPLYIRVNESKVEEGLVCEITGTRFDYTQLAWNVADDQYVVPLSAYNQFTVPAPADFTYEPDYPGIIYGSSGRLSWTPVASDIVNNYILYIHTQGDIDSNGNILFREIGRVDTSPFYLPAIDLTDAIFGIRSISTTGRQSEMVTTGNTAFTVSSPLTRSVEITTNNVAFVWQANNAGWNVPSITLNTEVTGYTNPFYQWYIDDVFLEGETGSSIVVLPFDDFRTRRYKVEVGETGNFSATQTEDFITLLSVQEGSDAYIINLTNESVQIETGSDGSVPSGTFPLTIGTGVARGSTIVTTGYGIVYSLEEPEGIVATIDSTTGVITVTAITGLSNTITVVAEVTPGVFLRKLLYVSKLVPGVSPPLLSLKTTSPGFLFENSTATTTSTPDSITLTAVFENISGQATFVAEAFDISNVSLGNITLPAATHTASNSSVVISDELFISIANTAYVVVTASLDGLSDTITLYRLNGGENAVNLYLHNENHSVPATSDGTVTDLDEAFTYIYVFEGLTNVTNDWTITKSDIGMNTLLTTDSGDPPRQILQVQAVTNTIATTTITATRTGYPTLERVFTITKAIAGAKGDKGDDGENGLSLPGPRSANGYIYYRYSLSYSPGQPNTPFGYNFNTGTFSSLDSAWTLNFTAPSSSDGQYWAVRYSVTESTYGGSQTVLLDGPFNWQNLNGLVTFSNVQSAFNTGVTVIDGGKITTNTINVNRITNGTTTGVSGGQFSLGEGASIAGIGCVVGGQATANEFTSIMYNSRTSGSSSHGIAGVTQAPDAFGGLFYNFYSLSSRACRSYGFIAGQGYGAYFKRMQTDRYDDFASLGDEGRGNVYLATNDEGIYTYRVDYYGAAPSRTAFIANFSAAGVFRSYNSSGSSLNKEVYLCNDSYALYSPAGRGKVHAVDGFGPFTAYHVGEIFNLPEIGDIVVDSVLLNKTAISDTYFRQTLSTLPMQKTAIGIVAKVTSRDEILNNYQYKLDEEEEESQPVMGDVVMPPKKPRLQINTEGIKIPTENHYQIEINAVGEGQVNVCGENGNISAGDLIVTSSIPGKGMKQDDDIVRSYTVAKSRENVTFDSPDQVKMIACIYLCG